MPNVDKFFEVGIKIYATTIFLIFAVGVARAFLT